MDESVTPPVKVAEGHFYELEDSSTTEPDPKRLYIGGQRYALV